MTSHRPSGFLGGNGYSIAGEEEPTKSKKWVFCPERNRFVSEDKVKKVDKVDDSAEKEREEQKRMLEELLLLEAQLKEIEALKKRVTQNGKASGEKKKKVIRKKVIVRRKRPKEESHQVSDSTTPILMTPKSSTSVKRVSQAETDPVKTNYQPHYALNQPNAGLSPLDRIRNISQKHDGSSPQKKAPGRIPSKVFVDEAMAEMVSPLENRRRVEKQEVRTVTAPPVAASPTETKSHEQSVQKQAASISPLDKMRSIAHNHDDTLTAVPAKEDSQNIAPFYRMASAEKKPLELMQKQADERRENWTWRKEKRATEQDSKDVGPKVHEGAAVTSKSEAETSYEEDVEKSRNQVEDDTEDDALRALDEEKQRRVAQYLGQRKEASVDIQSKVIDIAPPETLKNAISTVVVEVVEAVEQRTIKDSAVQYAKDEEDGESGSDSDDSSGQLHASTQSFSTLEKIKMRAQKHGNESFSSFDQQKSKAIAREASSEKKHWLDDTDNESDGSASDDEEDGDQQKTTVISVQNKAAKKTHLLDSSGKEKEESVSGSEDEDSDQRKAAVVVQETTSEEKHGVNECDNKSVQSASDGDDDSHEENTLAQSFSTLEKIRMRAQRYGNESFTSFDQQKASISVKEGEKKNWLDESDSSENSEVLVTIENEVLPPSDPPSKSEPLCIEAAPPADQLKDTNEQEPASEKKHWLDDSSHDSSDESSVDFSNSVDFSIEVQYEFSEVSSNRTQEQTQQAALTSQSESSNIESVDHQDDRKPYPIILDEKEEVEIRSIFVSNDLLEENDRVQEVEVNNVFESSVDQPDMKRIPKRHWLDDSDSDDSSHSDDTEPDETAKGQINAPRSEQTSQRTADLKVTQLSDDFSDIDSRDDLMSVDTFSSHDRFSSQDADESDEILSGAINDPSKIESTDQETNLLAESDNPVSALSKFGGQDSLSTEPSKSMGNDQNGDVSTARLLLDRDKTSLTEGVDDESSDDDSSSSLSTRGDDDEEDLIDDASKNSADEAVRDWFEQECLPSDHDKQAGTPTAPLSMSSSGEDRVVLPEEECEEEEEKEMAGDQPDNKAAFQDTPLVEEEVQITLETSIASKVVQEENYEDDDKRPSLEKQEEPISLDTFTISNVAPEEKDVEKENHTASSSEQVAKPSTTESEPSPPRQSHVESNDEPKSTLDRLRQKREVGLEKFRHSLQSLQQEDNASSAQEVLDSISTSSSDPKAKSNAEIDLAMAVLSYLKHQRLDKTANSFVKEWMAKHGKIDTNNVRMGTIYWQPLIPEVALDLKSESDSESAAEEEHVQDFDCEVESSDDHNMTPAPRITTSDPSENQEKTKVHDQEAQTKRKSVLDSDSEVSEEEESEEGSEEEDDDNEDESDESESSGDSDEEKEVATNSQGAANTRIRGFRRSVSFDGQENSLPPENVSTPNEPRRPGVTRSVSFDNDLANVIIIPRYAPEDKANLFYDKADIHRFRFDDQVQRQQEQTEQMLSFMQSTVASATSGMPSIFD